VELLFNKKIQLNDMANIAMSMATLLDTYIYDGKVSVPLVAYKPYCRENCKSGLFDLNDLYQNHKEFIINIIETFFVDLLFTPSNIRDCKKMEHFLFVTLWAIRDIQWYENIENSRSRGYEHETKQIERAISTLSRYSDYDTIKEAVYYPRHKNETIRWLNNYFINHEKHQIGKKIVDLIKKYYSIQKATATRQEKIYNANKKVIEAIQKNPNVDESHLSCIETLLRTKS